VPKVQLLRSAPESAESGLQFRHRFGLGADRGNDRVSEAARDKVVNAGLIGQQVQLNQTHAYLLKVMLAATGFQRGSRFRAETGTRHMYSCHSGASRDPNSGKKSGIAAARSTNRRVDAIRLCREAATGAVYFILLTFDVANPAEKLSWTAEPSCTPAPSDWRCHRQLAGMPPEPLTSRRNALDL
jgi:hypothetical protein